MASFTSLLVATDFSIDGNNAVRRAALLAHEHGAGLHILHVLDSSGCKPLRDWFSPTIDIDLKSAQAHGALRRVAIEILGAYGVTSSFEVAVGDPFETVMQASERADLVVLGRRGHGRLKGLLVGRTVDRVLRICRRPVLVIKTPVEQSYRRVLVPIDFTAAADAAIRVAARMRREAALHVFHAINSRRDAVLRDADVPEHIIRETRAMEEAGTHARMRRKVARLGLDTTPPIDFALTYGPAVRSTLCHALKVGADLIVAGKQGRSTLGGFLLGSVSSRVLSGAECDMLIVPSGDRPAPHAVSTQVPRVPSQAPPENAVIARRAAANAEAWATQSWIHNTASFMRRRSS